jgi:hypothetical protein
MLDKTPPSFLISFSIKAFIIVLLGKAKARSPDLKLILAMVFDYSKIRNKTNTSPITFTNNL